MKRGILILLVMLSFFLPSLMPKAQAMDPVTIAILTPVAIKGAQIAAPYVIRGLLSGGKHMAQMGEDLLHFFRLPLGILQSTAGAPFGQFSNGCRNMVAGGIAPFKFTYRAVTLPLAFCNIGGL